MSDLEREALRLLRVVLEADAPERTALIDAHCEGDGLLAQRVRELLARVHEDETAAQQDDDGVGLTLGPYRVLRRIGHGGMGEVFLAERADGAFHRQVALKRIWCGFAPLTGRFLRERAILARLNHPYIAQLFDGGVTPQGQPWFAMEYVAGEPITQWCDRRQTTLEQRVDLFRQVCSAVQFAHGNLVVHRDIKPANVMVGADGTPKLLDFGIAKLLDEVDAAQTQTLAMTPAFAAPEQRQGAPVTTATDVYQLGLLLHVLLSGTSPGQPNESPQRIGAAWAALQRQQPDAATAAATARGTTPLRLSTALRGDLESIVSRATAQEPRERYPSVDALSDDLHRWLRHRPVQARRLGFGYRTRKFLRRNRIATVLVGVLAIAVVGAAGFAWRQLQAERAQFHRAESTVAFLRDLFVSTTPDQTNGAELTAEQLLDRASQRLPQQQDIDPVTRAYLEGELGSTYIELGRDAKAEAHLQRAIDALRPQREEHADAYLEWLADLAFAQIAMHKPQQALDMLATDDAFIRRKLPQAGRLRARLLQQRGDAALELGRVDDAERDFRAAVADMRSLQGPPQLLLVNVQASLGRLLSDRNRYAEALQFYQQAQRDAARVEGLGPGTRDSLAYYLALAQAHMGQYDAAIAGYRAVLPRWIAREGETHPYTDVLRIALARAYDAQGRFDEARTVMGELRRTLEGNDANAERIAAADAAQARIELDALQFDAASASMERASAHFERSLPQATMRRARMRNTLGEVLVQQRQCDRAERVLAGAASDVEQTVGAGPHIEKARALDGLGRCRLLRGDAAGAQKLLAQARQMYIAIFGAADRRSVRSGVHLRWAQARASGDGSVLRTMRPQVQAAFGAAHPVSRQFDDLLDRVAKGRDLPSLRAADGPQSSIDGARNTPVGLVGGD